MLYEREASEPYPKTLAPGDVLRLVGKGPFPGLPRYSGAKDFVIERAIGGGVITGSAKERQNSAKVGVSLSECAGVILRGLQVTSFGRGIRAIDCRQLVLDGCKSYLNGVEGAQLDSCSGLHVTGSEFYQNGQGASGYPKGKGHGLYVANDSFDIVLEGILSHDNNGSGIQCNFDPQRGDMEKGRTGIEGVIQNCELRNNAREGGAALNLASLSHGTIDNVLCVVLDNDSGGLVLFVDHGDDRKTAQTFACRGNQIRRVTTYSPAHIGRYGLKLADFAAENDFASCIFIGDPARELAGNGDGEFPPGQNSFTGTKFTDAADLAAVTGLLPRWSAGDFRSATTTEGWQPVADGLPPILKEVPCPACNGTGKVKVPA